MLQLHTQGGKQPTGEPHPPTHPPPRVLYKKEEGRGARLAGWLKILGLLRETKGTPHCWLRLVGWSKILGLLRATKGTPHC